MAKVTLQVDKDTLRRARKRALDEDTSVNSVVASFLSSYAGDDKVRTAMKELVEMAKASTYGSGEWTWNRDELYDDVK